MYDTQGRSKQLPSQRYLLFLGIEVEVVFADSLSSSFLRTPRPTGRGTTRQRVFRGSMVSHSQTANS